MAITPKKMQTKKALKNLECISFRAMQRGVVIYSSAPCRKTISTETTRTDLKSTHHMFTALFVMGSHDQVSKFDILEKKFYGYCTTCRISIASNNNNYNLSLVLFTFVFLLSTKYFVYPTITYFEIRKNVG